MINKSKTLSDQEKGKLNAKKIQDWLDTVPVVPFYHGKVNKTAIFKMHGIPKSTIDTNQALRDLFAIDGPIEELAAEKKQNEPDVDAANFDEETVNEGSIDSSVEVMEQVKALKRKLNSIQLDLASEEFLIATGRYIPRLYSDSGSS